MSWDRDLAIELYEGGMGPREVAREVEGPYTSVYRHITGKHYTDQNDEGEVKVLVADIETAPTQAYVWSRWKQNIYQDQVVSEGYVLCWAARWLGSDVTITDSLFKNKQAYWRDHEDDKNVVASMWRLLNEADIVIFQNGDKFDIPVLNTRFLLHGFKRPAPYKTVDTYKIAKRSFKFPSASLDSMASYLGIGRKQETGGFKLWTACMEGDAEAWDKMVGYCAGDVELLEKVYMTFRHWDHRHPNMALYSKDKGVCGVCGSPNLRAEDKDYFTSVNRYSVFRCADCGALSRSRISSLGKEDRQDLHAPCGK